jgi:low affinity Fe/Cu permease
MTKTLMIILLASTVAVLTFVVAMRSVLRENREIDKKIDYSKLRSWQDDEDD